MLLLAALAASGQAGPRDGSGSDEAAGHHSLRHWLSGLTISWPDTTVVVTSPERDPRGGHPLYVTISGAVCSKSHIEAVRSEFLDGHLSSEAEASSELYVAVDHFGVECEVSRVLVEQEPPPASGSMLVPLQLGEKLYLDLYAARNWPTGVTFTLSDASVATRLRLFTVGEERLPDLDLIDTQLDLRPEHLSVSLHGVGLPLPGARVSQSVVHTRHTRRTSWHGRRGTRTRGTHGALTHAALCAFSGADLLANTALSAVMLGWGAAERLDYSGLLSSMLSSSLRAAFAEQALAANGGGGAAEPSVKLLGTFLQVLPAQVAQVHAFLAALAAADGKLSRPEPPLPPEALRWRDSSLA